MENAASGVASGVAQSTGMVIVIPKEYPLIILACTIICGLCYLTGFCATGRSRAGIFNQEFMKGFEVEHEKAFPGTKPAAGGFPDCGDGRYGQKLEYKDWVTFCNAFRVHSNFVEQLPMMLTWLLIGGLFLPFISMIVGFLACGGRIIYSVMYVTRGSDARRIGAFTAGLPLNLLAIATLVMAIIQAFKE